MFVSDSIGQKGRVKFQVHGKEIASWIGFVSKQDLDLKVNTMFGDVNRFLKQNLDIREQIYAINIIDRNRVSTEDGLRSHLDRIEEMVYRTEIAMRLKDWAEAQFTSNEDHQHRGYTDGTSNFIKRWVEADPAIISYVMMVKIFKFCRDILCLHPHNHITVWRRLDSIFNLYYCDVVKDILNYAKRSVKENSSLNEINLKIMLFHRIGIAGRRFNLSSLATIDEFIKGSQGVDIKKVYNLIDG